MFWILLLLFLAVGALMWFQGLWNIALTLIQ